ncbi:MAG: SDR family NAD(P)-dependent oxidoreductase [Novosphingobium sp.]|nr:SDR family NAD(P)-dependent oxidoreductase [Novosphingobium sp.]
MDEGIDYKARYGDWAMVVGASYGLGEALARELARRGMNVVITARGHDKLALAASRIRDDFRVDVKTVAADLSDPGVLDVILAGLGGTEIDFLIFNAALEHGGEFIVQDVERHLANIQVNCVAPTVVVHHFARRMAERGRGGVVISSSLAAAQGLYAWSSYGASKSYENLLGQALWFELKRKGVDAATFMIGSTYTPSFQRNQKLRQTPFAETRTPEGLPEGTPVPQDPEEAAANLFAQLDKEWLPLIYANPRDEENAGKMAALTLAERITLSSEAVVRSFEAAPGAKSGEPQLM